VSSPFDQEPPREVPAKPRSILFSEVRIRLPQKADIVGPAGLLILVLFLCRGAIFGGQVFFERDIHLVWYPQIEAFVRAIAAGSWPVWDPCQTFGQPLLADPSAQVLYPPTWLNLILPPWVYYTLFVAGHFLASSWGLHALARRLGLSRAGAFVAASLWLTCGPYNTLVNLWHHFAGASWIPILFLAADTAMASRRSRDAVLWGGAMAGQVLAGSADMCAMTNLAIAAFALVRHVQWRRGGGRVNRALLASAVTAGGIGVGATAMLWLPALDLLSRTARSELPVQARTYWSVHPLVLMETLFPSLWSGLPLSNALRDRILDSREPLIEIYLGVGVVGLVAACLVDPKSWPLRRFFSALVVLGVFVALGRHTPFYAIAVWILPPLKILRYPVKAMVLVGFGWAVLGGMGFESWRGGDFSRRRWVLAVAAPMLILSAANATAACLAPRALSTFGQAWAEKVLPSAELQTFLGATAFRHIVGACLAGGVFLLAVLPILKVPAGALLGPLVALLAVGDLTVYHRNQPLAPRTFFLYRPEILNSLGKNPPPRVYVYDYVLGAGPHHRTVEAWRLRLALAPPGWELEPASALAQQMMLAPSTAGRWDIQTAYEFDLRNLHPRWVLELSALLRAVEGTPVHLRLLRLGGVSHVIAVHDDGFEDLTRLPAPRGFLAEPLRLFAVPDTLPRTYVVGAATSADGIAGMKLLMAPEFDPAQQVLLSKGGAVAPSPSFSGTSRLVEARPDHLRIEAELNAPGYVVLLDTYDPGWRARVDGVETEVLRANHAFRALRVGAGRHVIEYFYRPRALLLGGLLSLTSVAVGLSIVVRAIRSRARASAPPRPAQEPP